MYSELNATWAALTAPGQTFEIHTLDIFGAPMRCYKNVPPSLREIWLASTAHGDADYLIFDDERYSYRQAAGMVASIANWLQQQGVKPGDRVAIAMRNYPEWMLGYWAITAIGAVVVGINAWWSAPELAYALEDASPRVIIADRERLQRLDEVRGQFPDTTVVALRMTDERPLWAVDWAEVLTAPPVLPACVIDPEQVACIFYTSGTTGKPKGAQLTHRGCVNNIFNVIFSVTVQQQALVAAGYVPDPGDAPQPPPVALLCTPLFHVTGNNCVAQVATVAGGGIVHMYKWDVLSALKLIEREKISVFNGVPMMSREVLAHPEFGNYDTSSLQTVGGGGAALQPDLVARIDAAGDNFRPNTGYGMTETCGIITSLGSKYFVDRPDSVGRAMPTFDVKCVDAEGHTVATNEVGELWVRGAPVIKGYLNRPEATAEDITDRWLHTGDIGRIDGDGFIYLVDRARDMVLRGGENVYCAEVENALFSHEGVAECVAFAVPDDRLGEEVGAAVYFREGVFVSAEALKAHCRKILAPYKVPRYVWILDDPLPRNANGKFLKRELKETLSLDKAG
ncbi:MAG: class I adenylate-forming enzyme family protein [Parahaliea sp.]